MVGRARPANHAHARAHRGDRAPRPRGRLHTHAAQCRRRSEPGAGGHGVDSRRRVLDGGRRPATRRARGPRGHGRHAADPSRVRRSLLDGRDRGHQRAVRGLREGHRLRHGRGEEADARGVPHRGRGEPGRGLGRLHSGGASGAARRSLPLVGLRARGELAPSARTGERHQGRPREAARGARGLRRRRSIRTVGGQAVAHRGGMGVRRTRGPERRALSLGRRAQARRPLGGQHLRGTIPGPGRGERRGRLHRPRSRRAVRAQRVRSLRRRRKRLGMGERLVSPRLLRDPRRRGRRGAQPARAGPQLRSGRARPAQARAARRLVPVHRAVLHALHARHAGQGRSADGQQPRRLPLRPESA